MRNCNTNFTCLLQEFICTPVKSFITLVTFLVNYGGMIGLQFQLGQTLGKILITLSFVCVCFSVSAAERTAPKVAFTYFQVYDVWGYIPAKVLEETSSRYIFHKDDASILFTWSYIVNDDPYASDLYYEFMSRKVGSDTWKISKVNGWTTNTFQWNAFEQGMQGLALNDLESYEFAVRACNPYGCNSARSLSKPIFLDYPEFDYSTIFATLNFEVFDVAASKIRRQNYCFADPITKKCKGDFFRVSGSLNIPASLGLYQGTTLISSQNKSSNNGSVSKDIQDLPVGTYGYTLTGSASIDQSVRIHKRFYVFVPTEGKITQPSSVCSIDPNNTTCNGQVTWEFTGDFPACIYKIDGTTTTELACAPAGPYRGIISVPLTASPSNFEIRAKEPSGIRSKRRPNHTLPPQSVLI